MKLSLTTLLPFALLLVTALAQDGQDGATATETDALDVAATTPTNTEFPADCACWTDLGAGKVCADNDDDLSGLCSLPLVTYLVGAAILLIFFGLLVVDKLKYKHVTAPSDDE